jgi:MFS family permease
MKRIFKILSYYEAAVWIRFFGSAITSITNFMLRPFLILYLYDRLDGTVILPLLIVGLQPLASIMVSLLGGGLSDRFGRKPVMVASLLVQALTMTGFIFADSVWAFALLSFLNGFGVPLFVPAANAQITDIVPQDKRGEVFALLHTAFNVGPAIGPLIGLAVFAWNQAVVFAVAATAFGLYTLIVWWKIPETLPEREAASTKQKDQRLSWIENKKLYLYTLFAVPIGLLYSQVETTLPLHLKANFENHTTILAILFTVNAVLVMSSNIWIAKKTEKKSSTTIILLSYIMFALVSFGYGYAPNFLTLIIVEIIFSFTEMTGINHLQKFVSLMAPSDKRGRYFSIFGMYMQLPRLIGPSICGFILTGYGGGVMFSLLGGLILLGGILQFINMKKRDHQEDQVANMINIS